MSKTLKPGDRKGIVITNDAPMHVYGGVRGPITSMYYETVEKIASILSDQAKVTQVTSKGEKIALDFTNFDKDLDPYDDEIDEVLELITCTPDKIIGLEVTKTATISTDVEQCGFESLNTEIATVTQDGIVTGVKNGETSIRVSKSGYKTVSVPITVVVQPSITCNPSKISELIVGGTIKITTNPTEAIFESKDTGIATVTPEGVVEGIGVGATDIIVSKDGYKDEKVSVNVKDKPTITCTPSSVETLYVGEQQLITTDPSSTTFESESDAIATVTPEGVVEGVGVGATNIVVAKDGYKNAKVPVTVKEKGTIKCTPAEITDLVVDAETTITTVPTSVTFRSENQAFATVTPEGVVSGVKEGTTNIVITKDGYQDATVKVTVNPRKVVSCEPSSITDLVVGQTRQITATPDNATFRVEAEGVITVTEDGLVEAITQGEGKVIVEAEGYEAASVIVTTKNVE